MGDKEDHREEREREREIKRCFQTIRQLMKETDVESRNLDRQ
jgi:hypothetical protein